jgi:hypothetical protein
MPQVTTRPKAESINFRVDPELKAAFAAATAAEDKPAGQVLRDLMRVYVQRRRDRASQQEAQRQSILAAKAATDPASDTARVQHWIDNVFDDTGWTA